MGNVIVSGNKRRFTRIKLKHQAVVSLSDGYSFHCDTIEDLSISGCLISVPAPLTEGTTCKIEIMLGEETAAIIIEGTIIRYTNNTAAVNFKRIDPDSLFLLQNLIRYNSEHPETIEEEISQRPGIV